MTHSTGTSRLRSEAEALAIALDVGALTVADAVAWANGAIETADAPHWTICEIVTMGRQHAQDVAATLRVVPGEANADLVTQLFIERLACKTADFAIPIGR